MYSKTPLGPSLTDQNDTGQSQGHNLLPAQYQQPEKQADVWQISPAEVGTAALVRQGYLPHRSLPEWIPEKKPVKLKSGPLVYEECEKWQEELWWQQQQRQQLQGVLSSGLHKKPCCPQLCQRSRAGLQPGKAFKHRITAWSREAGTSEGL